jgi:hypothetical protein
MRGFLGAAAAAAALSSVMVCSPAKAAVTIYNLGVIGLGSFTFSGLADGPGAFTSYVKFQLGAPVFGSVSYSNTAAAGGAISGGNLVLDSCSTNCFGNVLTPTGVFINGSPLITLPGGTVQFAGFGPDSLSSGNYFLKLTGSIPAGRPDLPYTGTITVASAVPEPGTWAMMMLGFAGLAFASTRRRKPAAVAV